MKKRTIGISSVVVLAAGAILTAGGVDEFCYGSAQYRYQFRVLGIPFYSVVEDSWVTPYTEPASKNRWHAIRTVDRGKHKYTLAGQISGTLESFHEEMTSSQDRDLRTLHLAQWLTDQLSEANQSREAATTVRIRLFYLVYGWPFADDPKFREPPGLSELSLNELKACLEESAAVN